MVATFAFALDFYGSLFVLLCRDVVELVQESGYAARIADDDGVGAFCERGFQCLVSPFVAAGLLEFDDMGAAVHGNRHLPFMVGVGVS